MNYVYEHPKAVSESEVSLAIEGNDVERLRMIPIELGFHHDNWRYIQDVSVQLSGHADAQVRLNALLGLEYAARFKGRIEKNIVKPVLLRARKDPVEAVRLQAEEVIAEINHMMRWNIGSAKNNKSRKHRVPQQHEGTG